MRKYALRLLALFLVVGCSCTADSFGADRAGQAEAKDAVDAVILPLMREQKIPGMAVAVTIDGKSYFFNYGVASRETQQPVTSDTLFEIGSISKTFTATLASYAQLQGDLSLTDSVSKHLPSLRGSSFDHVSLINLATHTAGGLPLQVPDEIKNADQLMDYLKRWKPAYAAGTDRTYSNISIGLLGLITAQSMHQSFEDAMEKQLFVGLGMRRSYIKVPADQMNRYAQGYTKKDEPIRVSPGVLDSEAYGVKSTSADMIRFIAANMDADKLNEELRRAIVATHTGYFTAGELTQDLIWEQYPYPIELRRLLDGNSPAMIFEDQPATRLTEPLQPQPNVLIDKTGSTNGFGAYVAFIPAKKMGVVLLANKSYPIDARVTAAFEILTRLDGLVVSKAAN
jgi:CubicO group peptidase (beta-lactamase class C family)